MPSNFTENFNLSQWEPGDKVQRTDFNTDNAKIDAALKAEADARTALEAALDRKGNCRIVYTTYVGTGEYGPDHPITLTFDAPPLAVFVCGNGFRLGYLIRGWTYTMPAHQEGGAWFTTWGENSVTWYSADTPSQFSGKGATYHVVALLAAE